MLETAVIAIATSVDIFAVIVGLIAADIKLPAVSAAAAAVIGSAVLGISALAAAYADFLHNGSILIACKMILLVMGIYSLFSDYFRHERKAASKPVMSYSDVLSDPSSADYDHSRTLSLRESAAMGIALSADSVFTGISAGIAGLSPLRIFLTSAIFGIAAVFLGLTAGKHIARRLGKKIPADRAGGLILIILAITL